MLAQTLDVAEVERSLALLGKWSSRSKLTSRDRAKIRRIMDSNQLVCVPIWGIAALFGVSVHMARVYARAGVVTRCAIHKNVDLFTTSDARQSREEFQRLRNGARLTVAQAGRMISARKAAEDSL
jgi:hypothetical protein